MANGLKGRAIAYTAGEAEILTISGASKITLWLPTGGASVWTASQEAADAEDHRQEFDGDLVLTMDSFSKQLNSDILEPVHVALENGAKLHGLIWGQAAQWSVEADD